MTRREGELRVIVRRQGEVDAEVAKDTNVLLAWKMTRREGKLRVIVRRQGEVGAEVAKDADMRLAWKTEVSTVILPAKN